MKKWEKIGRTTYGDGGSDTTYSPKGYPAIRVESRKRAITHANRSGSWMHTTYFVMKNGIDVAERWTLKDAKEVAEMMIDTDKTVTELKKEGLL